MTDVIVIGGGAAGLAAAGALAGRGGRVVLLEARGRLGGRILTEREAGRAIPIELGAEFVHGEAEATFAVADAALLPVDEIPDEHVLVRGGSFRRIADFWGEIDRVRARIGRVTDRPFARFLARERSFSARTRRLALDFVRGYHAADPERISALALAAGDEESRGAAQNKQYRIATGYASLIEALRGRCGPRVEVRLGTVAHSVTWKRGDVLVRASGPTGADAALRARALVVAVPAAVLKAPAEAPASIRFDPSLLRLERDLEPIETGHVVKIVLRFRERFWGDDGWLRQRYVRAGRMPPLNFLHAPGETIPTWWTAAPARAPILTGWCGGPEAPSLAAGGGVAVTERALDALACVLGERRSRLEGLLEGAHWHDWSADPFARGAYSWVAAGGLAAQKRLCRPIDGTIFVAGEATSIEETGTVSGAIASGERAAAQAWRALGGS